MEINELYIHVGSKIRETRKRMDLTLNNLSEKSGVGWSFLAKIETGKGVPSLRSILMISKALNLSMKDIFGDTTYSTDKRLERELISSFRPLNTPDKARIVKIVKLVTSPTSYQNLANRNSNER